MASISTLMAHTNVAPLTMANSKVLECMAQQMAVLSMKVIGPKMFLMAKVKRYILMGLSMRAILSMGGKRMLMGFIGGGRAKSILGGSRMGICKDVEDLKLKEEKVSMKAHSNVILKLAAVS